MAIKIRLPYSTTASALPTAGNLITGEMAVNVADQKLYVKDNVVVKQVIGSQGPQGMQGTGGAPVTGLQGTQGIQGTQGPQGTQGSQGLLGFQGTTGPSGLTGFAGGQGSQGAQGSTGPVGIQGSIGPQGLQGIQGGQGGLGGTGATGPQGRAYGSIPVLEQQTILANYRGPQGPASGVQGAQGPQGSPGVIIQPPGVAPPEGPGSCFLKGSPIAMADGTFKPIEDIQVGEYLLGAHGSANPVLALNRPLLGDRTMSNINGEHMTTLDHAHLRPDNTFGAVSLYEYVHGENNTVQPVITVDGSVEQWLLPGFAEVDMDLITQIEVGDMLVTVDGSRQVKTLENVKLPADTQLYNFVMGGDHTYFVSDYCVTGFLNGIDFDYRNWKPNGKLWTANDYRRLAGV